MRGKSVIRSVRKGSVQWNEDDRLALATLLAKAGYAVRIGRQVVSGQEGRPKPSQEYIVEYWEENQ